MATSAFNNNTLALEGVSGLFCKGDLIFPHVHIRHIEIEHECVGEGCIRLNFNNEGKLLHWSYWFWLNVERDGA